MGNERITVLVVEPGKVPEIKKIRGLREMQKIVGGIIQPLYPFEDEVALVVNDEGKLLGLPMNRELRNEEGVCYDIVCGTFFIVGAPVEYDHFTSLTEDQVQRYSLLFAMPRTFLCVDGDIIILPYNKSLEGSGNEG